MALSPEYSIAKEALARNKSGYAEEGRNTLYQAQYTHESSEVDLLNSVGISNESEQNMIFQQIKISTREKKPGPFGVPPPGKIM